MPKTALFQAIKLVSSILIAALRIIPHFTELFQNIQTCLLKNSKQVLKKIQARKDIPNIEGISFFYQPCVGVKLIFEIVNSTFDTL